MRGGALPPALLAAALGFALAFVPRRTILWGVLIFAVVAIGVALVPIPTTWVDAVFLGGWASIALTAATVHWRGGPPLPLLLAVNAGIWSGLVVAVQGSFDNILLALPAVLLGLPGAWLAAKGGGLAVKVVASWLIAVSIFAAALPMVATPGYVADHRE